MKTRFRKHGLTSMLIVEEDQVMVAWVLSMQKIGPTTITNESCRIDSNKANTFLKRGTKDLLVALVQKEMSLVHHSSSWGIGY